MGQYHLVANLDKREYIHPHRFGDGLKLLEFGCSGEGTMMGLALLLAASNRDDSVGQDTPFSGNRGGGDFHVWADPYGDGRDVGDVVPADHELAKVIVGRWAGDRIAIIGDYAEDEDIPTPNGQGFWNAADQRDNPWATRDEEEENALWSDISASVYRVMKLDYYTRQSRNEAEEKSPWIREQVERGDPYSVVKS